MKRFLTLALCMALCLTAGLALFTGCKKEGIPPKETDGQEVTRKPNDDSADALPEHDFGGKTFYIYNSVNEVNSFGTSNIYIEGSEENQDSVSQYVIGRNSYIEENMNAQFRYINVAENYENVTQYYRQVIMNAGPMDLFINKLFPLVNLSLEGYLANVANNNYFDLYSDYWYTDYMNELSLDGNTGYILAGDYFIDVIRSANVLAYNMTMMDEVNSENGGHSGFVETVKDGQWTIEKMIELSNAAYVENGNRYGYVSAQIWGASIPLITGFDLNFISVEDGTATVTLNNERSGKALDSLKALFFGIGTPGYTIDLSDNSAGVNLQNQNFDAVFQSGNALFAGGYRFANMARLVDMETKWGVVIYPKLDEGQTKYISATHDTTEVGAVPRSCSDRDSVLQLLEYMGLLTNRSVMREYYDKLLKLRYSKEPIVAEMVDLIHDNLGGSFVVGYNNAFGDFFMWEPFYQALIKDRSFSAYYPTYSSQLKAKADNVMRNWQKYLE